MTVNAPEVTPERIQRFYEALAAMHVELDADPLEQGPKRLNEKTSECRGFLSQTERIFVEVSQDLHWYRREHRRASAAFELSVQELFANDPDTRAGRNITDRLAIAHTKLRVERERISELQFAVEDLEAVLLIVKAKRNDLKDVAGRIRDQLKLCQEEIGLGNRWGSYRRPSGADRGSNFAGGRDELEDLLDGALASIEKEAEEIPIPPSREVPNEEVEEDSIDSLFDHESVGGNLSSSMKSDEEADRALESVEAERPKTVVIEPRKDPVLDSILEGFDS